MPLFCDYVRLFIPEPEMVGYRTWIKQIEILIMKVWVWNARRWIHVMSTRKHLKLKRLKIVCGGQRRKQDQILVLLDDGNGYHNGNISSIPLSFSPFPSCMKFEEKFNPLLCIFFHSKSRFNKFGVREESQNLVLPISRNFISFFGVVQSKSWKKSL